MIAVSALNVSPRRAAAALIAAAVVSLLAIMPNTARSQNLVCPAGTTNPDYCLTAQDVNALLSGDAKKVEAVLKKLTAAKLIASGVTLSYTAPGKGKITVTLKVGNKVVGKVTKSVSKAGAVKIKVKLSASGKKYVSTLVKKKKSVTLKVTEKFVPASGGKGFTKTTKSIKLKKK